MSNAGLERVDSLKQEDVRSEHLEPVARPFASDADNVAYERILAWSDKERRTQERKLVRCIDLQVMAPILLCYILNYLDRNSIAQARVSGLAKATHITGDQYALVNGIFYISYIIFQTPANILIAKTRPSIFIPAVIFLWSVISSMTAVCKSLGDLIAVRFILGIVEAPFYPGAVFYLSCWYTRKEIGRRIALLVSGICISNMFAGLISAGIISGLKERMGIAGWQWIFIIEGSISAFVAICMLFVLPDYPSNTRRFDPQTRVLSIIRLQEDTGATEEEDVGFLKAVGLAIKDYRTWCFGSLQFAITMIISFNLFFPTVIEGAFGYKNKVTILLLSVPPYFIATLTTIGIAWNADRTQKRALHYLISIAVAAVGLIMLIALVRTTHSGAKYVALFVLAAGSFPAYACGYPWLASVMPRPRTKRAVSVGIANSMANTGAFVSGYVYYAEFGPTYFVSWCIVLGFAAFAALMICLLSIVFRRRNLELQKVEDEYKRGNISNVALDSMGPEEQLAARSGFRLVQ